MVGPIALACALGAAACGGRPTSPAPDVHEITGPTMGTRYSVKIAGPLDAAARRKVVATIEAELARIDELMSPWRDDSAASYEVFATFFRLTGSGFQIAIVVITVIVGIFVSRPFCHWVCPVDTTEQIARFVRVRALRLFGREPRSPRASRPVFLPVVPPLRWCRVSLRWRRALALRADHRWRRASLLWRRASALRTATPSSAFVIDY